MFVLLSFARLFVYLISLEIRRAWMSVICARNLHNNNKKGSTNNNNHHRHGRESMKRRVYWCRGLLQLFIKTFVIILGTIPFIFTRSSFPCTLDVALVQFVCCVYDASNQRRRHCIDIKRDFPDSVSIGCGCVPCQQNASTCVLCLSCRVDCPSQKFDGKNRRFFSLSFSPHTNK